MTFRTPAFLLSILALTGVGSIIFQTFRTPAFLLSIFAVTDSQEVPPPSDIIVICRNFDTMVYWHYSKELPHTTFTLTISDKSFGELVKRTDLHRYNLTRLVWGSAQSSMDLHSVKITAMQGGRQSQAVETTFTYNGYHTADVQCYLDLPPLSLSVKDLKARVDVVNPLHVYEELKLLKDPLVEITAHLLNVPQKHREMKRGWTIIDGNKLYTSEFCFPKDQQRYCIRLEGKVFNNGRRYSVLFRNTGPVCALASEGNSKIHRAILVGGGVIGGAAALAAAPLALAAAGFTSAGITVGSLAASLMSSTAIANGGGVAAGSVVALLQSLAAGGLTGAVSTIVGGVGAAVGGAAGALVDWWYSSPLDCRALSSK